MRRREFIALAGASVALPVAALAQEPGRTYRVGGLSPSGRDSPAALAMLNELPRFGFDMSAIGGKADVAGYGRERRS
jgi:hypothetical protein